MQSIDRNAIRGNIETSVAANDAAVVLLSTPTTQRVTMQADDRELIHRNIGRTPNDSLEILSTLETQPRQVASGCFQLGLPFCNDRSSNNNGTSSPSYWNGQCGNEGCSSMMFGISDKASQSLSSGSSNGNGISDRSSQNGTSSHVFLSIGNSLPPKKHEPLTNPTESTDKLLSNELKRLTLQEREKVADDIHGIAKVVEETPKFVKEHLAKFDEEIMKLRRRHGRNKSSDFAAAYEKARFLNPHLVLHDADFKLMFLRADGFDAAEAASRMMKYFSVKLEMFGLDLLTKQPITQDDLNEDDKRWLGNGCIQPLPGKDRAGRRVMAMLPKHESGVQDLRMSISHFRALWYVIMASFENDVEVQRKGTVDIMYLIGGDYTKMPRPSPQTTEYPKKFNDALPRRVVAMHAIYDDPMIGPLIFILPLVVSKFRLIRFRSHYGSYVEGMYALRSFGIPAEDLPVDKLSGRILDNTDYYKYLEERKAFEDELVQRQLVSFADRIIPTSNDVLLGRGRPFHNHLGNKRLAALIEQQKTRYDEAGTTYGKKNSICEEVVDMVHEAGGRFLKKQETDSQGNGENESSAWEVVGRDMAREKISHGFRTINRFKRNNSVLRMDEL